MKFKSDLHVRTLPELIECFRGDVVLELYHTPCTCIVLLRELTCEEQVIIVRLLFMDQPLSVAVIASWFLPNTNIDLTRLKRLKVLEETRSVTSPSVSITDNFKLNLKKAIAGDGSPWILSPLAYDPKIGSKTKQFLTAYAIDRWETLLHFMVGSENSREQLSDDTVAILKSSGLIEFDMAKDVKPSLTASGFQFLLQETSAQVWFFMSQYLIKLNGSDPEYLVEILTFLLQMSQCNFGRDYSSELYSEKLMAFIQLLRELGLVYMRKRKDARYYPTQIAVNIKEGSVAGARSEEHVAHSRSSKGFIVVESNFRVYAYTDSDLHAALIAMFAVVSYRFPGCICCVITRDSVRQSLLMGISASKILNYLFSHLHPKCESVPSAVIDQINLWERETGQLQLTEGVLYSNFLSQPQFDFLHEYALELDPSGILYSNPDRRVMVVTESHHDPLKKHWKKNKKLFES